ncbi:MAG: serine--tRNA ligase, partial [Desulfuromusa sp.]|nr:serine--tRNA ligase [Desulfuromusa sp.]
MLDIKYLRENFAVAEKALSTRAGKVDLSGFQTLDQQRRELLSEVETLKAEKNKVSALIGRTKDKGQVQGEITRMKDVSAQIKGLDEQLRKVEEQL